MITNEASKTGLIGITSLCSPKCFEFYLVRLMKLFFSKKFFFTVPFIHGFVVF